MFSEKQVLQPSSSVISLGRCNIVLYSSWWGSANGIVWLGGLSRSAGVSSSEAHLEWESAGLVLRDQRAAGHAPLGSFLIQSQDQEELHLRVDLAHRFRRAPTELEEFPPVFGNVKDRNLRPSPPNSPDWSWGLTVSRKRCRVAKIIVSFHSNALNYPKNFISHFCHKFFLFTDLWWLSQTVSFCRSRGSIAALRDSPCLFMLFLKT